MTGPENTLLIVDDESYVRQSFTDHFEDCLWNAIQAESGEDALRILETEPVGAAIVDIRMGGMDGNAFIREACRRKIHMAFVICTGSPEYEVPDDLANLPCVCDQSFKKPVTNFDALEQAIVETMANIGIKRDGAE